MGRPLAILLVEDEPFVTLTVAEMLGEMGHSVIKAQDGAAGLEAFERHPGVDLLITDIGLPRMRGDALAARCRETRPDLPVVFITGYPATDEVEMQRTAFVGKPFHSAELISAILEIRPLKPGQTLSGRREAIRRVLRDTLATVMR
ncbi:response regulator [Alsobacter sp. SYSU BS001988]|jgi:two-component system, cell cycle sensor histidine kinase and response regulator CckA